jgi:molecular chaperone GrpE
MSEEDATGDPDAPAPGSESGEASDEERASVPEETGTETDPAEVADRLIARIAEHDESLAADVRRIIERGAELREVATDLETELDERDRDVATLRERVEELEAVVEARDRRIAELETEVAERDGEIEDLQERLRRKQADFQNYKKRAERERERIQERAAEDVIERMLDVRDNLRRALQEDDPDVKSLTDGVEMTLREFDRVLEQEDVSEIDPDPGAAIDPTRHEVMMRADSDQPEDTVADVYRPGYEMAGEVVREAQVTVSTGPPEETDEEESTEGQTAKTGDE